MNKRPKTRTHPWVKESEILNDKLNRIGNIKAIREFYWNRDVKKYSIKAQFYDDNKFEETADYLKLCYDYPELSLGFQWLLKARCGYKFNASVAKAAKIVTKYYPKFCPCCKTGQQNIEHWCVKCPTFLNVRLPVSDKLKLILRYFNENKFVDSNSNPFDNPGNNTHNNDTPNGSETNLNINNSSEIDPVEVSYSNSNENIIIEDSSSNFSDHVNSPVDSYSSVNDNFNVSNNHVSNNNSSVLNEVFKFLLGGRCNNYNSREWKNLCKCQVLCNGYLGIFEKFL